MPSSHPKYISRECPACGHTHKAINGARLRWRREEAGMSLRGMGRRAVFSAAYLSDVERGRRNVTVDVELAYNAFLPEVPNAR